MACLERSSPALKEILLKIYRAQHPIEIDHHLYEFGSVEYHIKSSASEPGIAYLSISTPFLSQDLWQFNREVLQSICSDEMEVVEPPRPQYQLTLRLDFATIITSKEAEKVIAKMSEVQAEIISCQLREMLKNVNSQDNGVFKPIKLAYHPREPFFVIKQELVDVGSSEKWSKAPACSWSPIPPRELRGELFEDLTTNGGFVSFEICPRHVKGKRLDKTVWNLLSFNTYLKQHVKSTKGFVQRRMRKRLEGLVQVLRAPEYSGERGDQPRNPHDQMSANRLVDLSKVDSIGRGCGDLSKRVKRIRFRTKLIRGFRRLRWRCLRRPSIPSSMRYTKLD